MTAGSGIPGKTGGIATYDDVLFYFKKNEEEIVSLKKELEKFKKEVRKRKE
jgi:hypothetical protein